MKKTLLRIEHNYKIVEYTVYFAVFLLSLRLIQNQILCGIDYKIHINVFASSLFHKIQIPHIGFHIIAKLLSKITSLSLTNIVPIMMSFVIIGTIKLTMKIFLSQNNFPIPLVFILFLSIVANIVIALYLPFFNKFMYLGQWSPNYWHSPTYTLLKPISLLSFFIMYKLIFKDTYTPAYQYVFTSFLFLYGTLVKPNFIICYIPFIFLMLLISRKEFKFYLNTFYIILPSVILLLLQFYLTYILKYSDFIYNKDSIKFTWFGVMKLYTPNLFVSLFLVIGFPLSILIFELKKITLNSILLHCWIFVTLSYLISGLLAEVNNFIYANFITSYNISLFILFVFSISTYISWFHDYKSNKYRIMISSILLTYHLFSGLIYLYGLLIFGTWEYIC